MEINMEKIEKDEYLLEGNESIYGSYPTIEDAVKALKLYRPDYVKSVGMVMRHRITAYIDNAVDCAEIVCEK